MAVSSTPLAMAGPVSCWNRMRSSDSSGPSNPASARSTEPRNSSRSWSSSGWSFSARAVAESIRSRSCGERSPASVT